MLNPHLQNRQTTEMGFLILAALMRLHLKYIWLIDLITEAYVTYLVDRLHESVVLEMKITWK